MSSRHVVKYRTRHKRLSDLGEEDTRHGFNQRIHVERSQTQPSDAVFCDVWDLNMPVTANQNLASYEYKQPKSRGAKTRGSPFIDLNEYANSRRPPHSLTMEIAPGSKSNYRSFHRKSHLRALPPDSTALTSNSMGTVSTPLTTGQALPSTNYTGNDNSWKINSAKSQCRKSTPFGIDPGRLPYPLAQSPTVYHPMAPQQPSNSAASHVPWKIDASHIPRGICHETVPVPNYDGNTTDNGFSYPGNEVYSVVQEAKHNLGQSTPSFYPIAAGGIPYLSPASSSLDRSYHNLPSGGHCVSTIRHSPTPRAPSTATNYPGQTDALVESYEGEWHQPLQTDNVDVPHPPSCQYSAEYGFSAVMSNVVQGGLPDFTYQQEYLDSPIGNLNGLNGYDLGPASRASTSASWSSYSDSESMAHSGEQNPANDSPFYPSNWDPYGSSLQNYSS